MAGAAATSAGASRWADLWACCFRREDDGLEPASSALDRAAAATKADAEAGAAEGRRSLQTLRRHTAGAAAAAGAPSMLLYSVQDLDRGQAAPPAARPRRARRVPTNAPMGVPIETDNFVGKVLWLQAPAGGSASNSSDLYASHFSGRRRRWEMRIQGKFKKVPKGELCIGVVLRDFNYDQAVAKASHAVKRLGLMFIKWKFYLSWGDRCEAALEKDAELSHLVTGLAGMDQVVVTPAGAEPPVLTGDMTRIGLERKAMGVEHYKRAVAAVVEKINTEDTYTFCFWGPSQCIDFLEWQFLFGKTISMAQFLEEWPLHFVIYDLERGRPDARHLESQKRYFLDLMFWSSTVCCEHLAERYNFMDCPHDLEQASEPKHGKKKAPQAGAAGPGRPLSALLRPFAFASTSSSASTREASDDTGSSSDGF